MPTIFDNTTPDYLYVNDEIVASETSLLTISCWGYHTTDVGGVYALVWIGDRDSAERYVVLGFAGYPQYVAFLYSYGSLGSGSALTTNVYTLNTWRHACMIVSATTARRVILDGNWASSGINITDIGVIAADRVGIGAYLDLTPEGYHEGRICEVGLWDAALTQAEVEALAAGYSPLFIRPDKLVAYWPLLETGAYTDLVNGNVLIEGGTPAHSNDPPAIIYPKGIHEGIYDMTPVGGANYSGRGIGRGISRGVFR